MMETLLESIKFFWHAVQQGDLLHSLGIWNYVIMSTLVIVEGPAATLLGAAAASGGYMNPVAVFFVAALSNMTSDLIWYTLGYSGKIEWAMKLGRKFGLRDRYVKRLQAGMHNHAAKIIFVAKLTNGFSLASLVAAGLTRVPIKRWLPSLVFAETNWTGMLVLIGFHATQALTKVEHRMEIVIVIMSIIFLAGILVWARHMIKQEEKLGDSTSNLESES
jgi:membrane protein DedA with SNARE-associated domain